MSRDRHSDPLLDDGLPSNPEAEKQIIGGLLALFEAAHPRAIDHLDFVRSRISDSSLFALEGNRIIWRAMCALRDQGMHANAVAIAAHIDRQGLLSQVHSAAHISSFSIGVSFPDEQTLESTIRLLEPSAAIRELWRQTEYARGRIMDADDPWQVIAELEVKLKEIQEARASRPNLELFRTAMQIHEDPQIEREWILPGYLTPGALTEVISKIKGGKTTLALGLARAAITGGMLFGNRIPRQAVVYLTEQPKRSWDAQATHARIHDSDAASDLHVLLHSDVRHLPFAQVIKLAVEKCQRVGSVILVVDTFGKFAGFKGTEENDSGKAQEAVDELVWAASQGLAVWSNRHAVKGDGRDVSDVGRGSGAVSGGADIIIHLKRLEGNQEATLRELAAIGRFPNETPEQAVIQLDKDSGKYRLIGDVKAVKAYQTREKILRQLPASSEKALNLDEIVSISEGKRSTVQKVLAGLEEAGSVKPTIVAPEQPRKGHPQRYFLAAKTGAGSNRRQQAESDQKPERGSASPKEGSSGTKTSASTQRAQQSQAKENGFCQNPLSKDSQEETEEQVWRQ